MKQGRRSMEGSPATLPLASNLSLSLLRFLSPTFALRRPSPISAASCLAPSPPTPPTTIRSRPPSDGVRNGLRDLQLRVTMPDSGRSEQIPAEELPVLAKEVARVKTISAYAEGITFRKGEDNS